MLIVEDEALIAEELRDRLTALGADIVGMVDSADTAVETTARLRPDLVLMDIRLRGPVDGIEAALTIRRESDLPVVFLTAHADRGTLERAKHAGPFGYIVKPLQGRDLQVAIEMAINRHRLEQRLRESERRYAQTLASIGDSVLTTDPQERITFMNPAAEVLTGWTLSEARGRSINDVLPLSADSQGTRPVSPIHEALGLRRAVRFDTTELYLSTRDGAHIPVADCATPIADGERVTGAVIALQDARSRRQAQDAQQRTQQEQFQAQKLESVGRLAAGIAHDFNNLLSVIVGCAELALEDEALSDSTRGLLNDIVGAGTRAANVTRQVLAFSSRQTSRPEALDLNKALSELYPMLRRLIREDIALDLELSKQPVVVHIDPSHLDQIVVNLVVNARDAIQGSGRITIGTAPVSLAPDDARYAQAPSGRYTCLSVSDTGCGIDETIKGRIFEPYFTTKELGKGTGLGLASVFGTVKQAGGFLTVSNQLGSGARFDVHLPASNRAPAVTRSSGLRAASGSETILLVEDQPELRALEARVLRSKGYAVLEASNGLEAIGVYESHRGPIHLLVTDVVMPELGGTQLFANLKERDPMLRVLYTSGYTPDGAALGDAPFLLKPFKPEDLALKVTEALAVD